MKRVLIVALSLSTTVLSVAPAPAQSSGAGLAVPAMANEAMKDERAEDIALTKDTITLLQAKNFGAVKERFDPAVVQITDDTLRQMSGALGTSEPESIETISASEKHYLLTGEDISRIVLEYDFDGKWIAVDAAVKSKDTAKQFLRLYFTINYLPLREINAFRLLGKGMPQYLFLAVWLLIIVMTAYAIYFAYNRNAGWRRWVLSIVAARVDAAPPFSALFTLWLSMIAAVGLASRPAFSRHFTYKAWWMRSSVPSQFQRSR